MGGGWYECPWDEEERFPEEEEVEEEGEGAQLGDGDAKALARDSGVGDRWTRGV